MVLYLPGLYFIDELYSIQFNSVSLPPHACRSSFWERIMQGIRVSMMEPATDH